MKPLTIILILILVILQYKLWLEKDGFRQKIKLKAAISAQENDNTELYKRNKNLTDEIYKLKHNQNYIEAVARKKMGMIKEGETYYQIADAS